MRKLEKNEAKFYGVYYSCFSEDWFTLIETKNYKEALKKYANEKYQQKKYFGTNKVVLVSFIAPSNYLDLDILDKADVEINDYNVIYQCQI